MLRIATTTCLVLALTPAALASGGNPVAQASGELVGGSTEAALTLGSAGVTVAAGTVIAVTGTSAAIITGDPELLDNSLDLAGEVASAPFNTPLAVDDDIIIAAPPPQVPHDAARPGE